MHASSLENMWKCYHQYISGGPLELRPETTVLDIGGADVNGSYREVFARPPFLYRVADIATEPGVDIVLANPDTIPLPDASTDIVISGQTFEHIEFFWRTFDEMARILTPSGLVILIVPSAGPIHRYPVDCYRFYPDSFGALARHAGLHLLESWLDERGPWRDLVGVFCQPDALPRRRAPSSSLPVALGWNGSKGSAEEEVIRGPVGYLEVLDRFHRDLMPVHYLEIGVRHGMSLALARGPATGIDPFPEIGKQLPSTTQIVRLTSDEYFENYYSGQITFDFYFIDGIHLFEHALRDFMNCERCAAPGAVIVIDDVLPNHPTQALRERKTQVWTGDVWRLVEILRRYRPDLFIILLDVSPAGLLLVAGLDPANRVLWENYNPIAREGRELSGPPPSVIARRDAIDPRSWELDTMIEVLKNARSLKCPPAELVARLRQVLYNLAKGVRLGGSSVPKLSVIIISYNMARELPRTIRSFSATIQRDIDPGDYEIILIDNGSTQNFPENELRALAPNLIIHRFQNATSSPVPAINFGLKVSRGDLVGICIDGARMASPGLLSKALAASRLHSLPMIGTIAFHLGPDVQMESIKHGYNPEVVDKMLADSGWESDGYRLFSVSTLAGSSAGGWFELPAESNALFLRREHWRAIGGWDEGFVAPGGGLANLDTWSRVCADPSGELIMLLGEATFHQVHGGVATNNSHQAEIQRLFHDEYVRLRGRPYIRPARKPLYFGSLPEAAKASVKYSVNRLFA